MSENYLSWNWHKRSYLDEFQTISDPKNQSIIFILRLAVTLQQKKTNEAKETVKLLLGSSKWTASLNFAMLI